MEQIIIAKSRQVLKHTVYRRAVVVSGARRSTDALSHTGVLLGSQLLQETSSLVSQTLDDIGESEKMGNKPVT